MIYDFHTHTSLSDGALSPLELIRRAFVCGYRAIAITDHVGAGELERIITEVASNCALAEKYWDIIAIAGVELTHVPAAAIPYLAKQARDLGARLIVVHGETITEPVEPGTNLAAIQSPHVDILAHPGFLSPAEAALAASNDTFLEITARKSHSFTNGHVIQTALATGSRLLLNSDAHEEDDLLSVSQARSIVKGAHLSERDIDLILQTNPRDLLLKIEVPVFFLHLFALSVSGLMHDFNLWKAVA